MAISLGYDGLYSACVRHEIGSKPVLDFLSFYPKEKQNSKNLLERLARESPARERDCLLQLSTDEYQWFTLDALNVPAEELKSAMRWRLKDLLDYSVDMASFDVITVPGDVSNAGRNQSLIAVVSKNDTIAKLQNLFAEVKLPLNLIDVPEMAQRNISARIEIDGRGLAMLSFDQSGGLLTVSFGGELYLSRRLDISIQDLRQSGEERNSCFERVSLELQRSLDHFDRQHNYITTAKMVLAPLGEVAEPLRAFLSANMYMPVEVLDLASVLSLEKIPELKAAERQQAFFYVIGAALRQEARAL